MSVPSPRLKIRPFGSGKCPKPPSKNPKFRRDTTPRRSGRRPFRSRGRRRIASVPRRLDPRRKSRSPSAYTGAYRKFHRADTSATTGVRSRESPPPFLFLRPKAHIPDFARIEIVFPDETVPIDERAVGKHFFAIRKRQFEKELQRIGIGGIPLAAAGRAGRYHPLPRRIFSSFAVADVFSHFENSGSIMRCRKVPVTG